jgi:serine/threonine-protein kinase
MIEGAALKFIMGALDAAVSLDMLRQTAAALDYAHAMGVLHLALEPAKMVVDDAGRLRLTGFGEGAITSWIYDVMPELILLPVSYYWAPEQFTNRRCDAMADQFSLAAIAFHMLTGQSPFHPADNVSDFHRIFEGKYPAAHEVNPEVPPAVSVTLRRGLASQPGDRFGSCGELVSALEIALRRKRPG